MCRLSELGLRSLTSVAVHRRTWSTPTNARVVMIQSTIGRMSVHSRGLWRYLLAIVAVLIAAAAAETLNQLLGPNRVSMVFLLSVLLVAVSLGSGPAYLAAAMAFWTYNILYLTEPRFRLAVEPEDTIVLAVFLTVAMLTGGLAGRVRDEARRSAARARASAALFQATREFSSVNDPDLIRAGLARHISHASRSTAAVWREGGIWTFPRQDDCDSEIQAKLAVAAEAASPTEPATLALDGWQARALRANETTFGVAAWRADRAATSDEAQDLINVLVDVGAAAIARAYLAESQAEAATLARTEQLRGALLSSLSHDLRTPLASILASVSSLREYGDQFTPEVREDLLATTQEEAERLNAFVANLLSMTKLDGGGMAVRRMGFDVDDVLHKSLSRHMQRVGDRTIVRTRAEPGVIAFGDPILVEQALSNVIENAIRFSPDGSCVRVDSRLDGDMVCITVSDEGPGVAAEELDQIFEKFYRSPSAIATIPGTGLGLSITRGLVEAMGGWVGAEVPEGGGLWVTMMLPCNES